ncbi:hypothetical protein E3N88_32932 [Mikania micrantha]|uniref:Protein kinase domain-containing protein n=1 Tax=Mikania micrantha TaxID=192012 RepID=A0A5N6MAD5_9ASTR|nr:hypothetical protein E3N88_32932 [Mikania micrantha]
MFMLQWKALEHLMIEFDDIKKATENFDKKYWIGSGGFGDVYKAELEHFDSSVTKGKKKSHLPKKRSKVAIKCITNREDKEGEQGFIAEIETLSKGTNQNSLKTFSQIGYKCLAEKQVQRPSMKYVIEELEKALKLQVNNDNDFVVDNACGTTGYVDPQYITRGVTREADIYTLGVVLFEMMCGRLVKDEHSNDLVTLVKHHYKKGNLDELVLEGIKDKIMPNSLTTYQRIAYKCLHDDIVKRPKLSELVSQLKKALEFQEDVEIWEAKLPKDYKEILDMSKTPEIYYNLSNKDLCEMFSKGILLKKGKVCVSVRSNEEMNEMVSATMFSFENNVLHNKRISVQTSRFQRVVKIMDISNLNIHIKIKTHFLSPNVNYGAHLVFKFCEPRKISSSKLMYVNLKYQMRSETLHAYFATCEDDEWMMVELCRFIPHKKDVEFKVLLQSLSRYYCGSGAIYVEGIHFRAINNATLKVVKPEVDDILNGAQRVLESNSDLVQQTSLDYDEITQLEDDEKLFSLGKANGKKCHMLPAKMFLYDSSNVKCFNWRSYAESRFLEEVEVLSNQLFRIKCKIEAQKLSADTDYACYLVFKLSQQCHGLHCPVHVQDVLGKNKKFQFLYFRSPRSVNLHGNKLNEDHHPMSLKLRCYEGTMSGLIVYGIEFRPI